MSARTRFALRLPALLPSDDRTLPARFGEVGDEAAFAALMRRHIGMVHGECRLAVRDEPLADDAVLEGHFVIPGTRTRASRARPPAASASSS